MALMEVLVHEEGVEVPENQENPEMQVLLVRPAFLEPLECRALLDQE